MKWSLWIVVIVLWFCAYSPVGGQGLPPEVQLDKHLLAARKTWNSGDYAGTANHAASAINLGLPLPSEIWYYHGAASAKAKDWQNAEKSLTKYITLAGRQGEFYSTALELLSEAEAGIAGKNKSGFSPSAGQTFTACGKKWKVYKNNVQWNETQTCINGLGGGWRTPTKSELQELCNEV